MACQAGRSPSIRADTDPEYGSCVGVRPVVREWDSRAPMTAADAGGSWDAGSDEDAGASASTRAGCYRAASAATIASRCAAVVPQQPPMMVAPASAARRA